MNCINFIKAINEFKYKFYFLLPIFLLFSNTESSSQINVDFSAEITDGCSPLIVQFTNLTNENDNYTYLWDFGNGNTSTLKNPISTYNSPGNYSVTLTVYDGLQDDKSLTKNDYINVYSVPSIDFSPNLPIEECAPHEIAFNSMVTPNSNNGTYTWDFGDGILSSEPNPVHTYKQPGIYNVTLVFEDINGCTGKITYENIITIKKPTAAFDINEKRSCSGELNTQFNNQSYGIGTLEYEWDFGDSQSSTESNPIHFYSTAGIFDVTLHVTDDLGCKDTLTIEDIIEITDTKADFSIINDTVCPNQVIDFTNTSINNRINSWDFGDSHISSEVNPSHSFSEPGNYIVKLKVDNYECSHTYSNQIHVQDVEIDFSISDEFSCQVPVDITYTPIGKDISSYIWDFGGEVTSSEQSPTHTYRLTSDLNKNGTESYSTKLTVTSKYGCSKEIEKPDIFTITIPKVTITTDNPISGCKPININFGHTITYNTTFDNVSDINWKIDEADITTDDSFEHSFNEIGEYNVQLTVNTQLGCSSSVITNITVGQPQNPNFTVKDKSVFCAYEVVEFNDLSHDPSQINNTVWEFGDGNQSFMGIPIHQYTDTGYMDVTLNVYHNGCLSKITKEDVLYINGPIASINRLTNCEKPYEAEFEISLKDADSYKCYFGDGDSILNVGTNFSHLYAEKGTYPVILYAYNTEKNCFYAYQNNIDITDPKAAFDTTGLGPCRYTELTFDPSSSEDASFFNHNELNNKYLWDFGDGTEEQFTYNETTHEYAKAGNYTIHLVIKDSNTCSDTITKEIKIYHPETNFSSNYLQGCIPVQFEFTDLTIHELPIVEWNWDFGDDQTSQVQNPIHTFQDFGNYNVILSVRNERGCESSITLNNAIKVVEPDANFKVSDINSCINDPIEFYDVSLSNIVEFNWNFGDGNTSNDRNPEHTYTSPGQYDISLEIIDDHGCIKDSISPSLIDIEEPPSANFSSDKQESNCYPFPVLFSNETIYNGDGSQKWIFGDNLTGSTIKNPQHIYSKPGSYDVSLIAYSKNECPDTITKKNYINIGGPYAEIQLADTACIYNNISFSMKNEQNISSIIWDFGDGYTSSEENTTHKYNQKGKLYPSLILKTNSSFACNKVVTDSIFINELLANFSYVDDVQNGCVPLNIQLSNSSEHASNFLWYTSNGLTSEETNPSFNFSESGNYTLRLISSDNFGCKDTLLNELSVYPLPTITITSDTFICIGNNIELLAEGGIKYKWSNENLLDNPNIDSPIASPTENSKFIVNVTDENNCVDKDSVTITVQQIPTVNLNDSTIIVGETIQVNIKKDEIKNYLWQESEGISCLDCPNPILFPPKDQTYIVSITDTSECFTIDSETHVTVLRKFSLDVPLAFTPNDDNLNDEVYVKGWGIRELIYFRVFNRLGQLIYNSNNIDEGWDGMFKGKPQITDTYNYVVKVLTYDDKILEKKGSIKLIR